VEPNGRGLPLPAHPAQLTAESPTRRLHRRPTPEKMHDPAPVCPREPRRVVPRPRWCTRPGGGEDPECLVEHLSSQPVIAELRLVPRAALAMDDDRTVESAAWFACRRVTRRLRSARVCEPRPRRPRADTGNGAQRLPIMGAESARSVLAALPLVTWPLLGPPQGRCADRWPQHPGPEATAGCGRWHARWPRLTAWPGPRRSRRGNAKGRRRGLPFQHAAHLEDRNRKGTEGDQAVAQPHL
jgi:hypothetical protein